MRHDGLAIEDDVRRAVRGVNQVHQAVEHSRRECTAQRILGDQLHVHGSDRARNHDRADDRSAVKVPHADTPAQQRIAGDHVQRAGGHHEIGGHHQVELRTGGDAVRIEIVLGRVRGPLAHELQVRVELGNPTGRPAGVGTHLRDQESAFLQRQEVVGDVGERAGGREQESRLARLRHIEEENAVLTPQQGQQAPTRQNVLVGGEMAVVRLITGAARRRHWHRPDDSSVARRVFVEVDDGKKVRRRTGLIARPDVERLRRSLVVVILPSIVGHRHRGERHHGHGQRPTLPAPHAACELTPYRSFRLHGDYRYGSRYGAMRRRDQFPAGSLAVKCW